MAFKLAKQLYKKEHEDRRDGNLGGTWKIRQMPLMAKRKVRQKAKVAK